MPPSSPRQRSGTALCLSGGGFRATLFHLGSLRRLNECGMLGGMDAIVSVSGGSITSAHLARVVSPWPRPGEVFSDWEGSVAAPLRRFCASDLRSLAALDALHSPRQTWRAGGLPAERIEDAVSRKLHDGALNTLPERPRFIFQATDLLGGTLFRFERDRLVCRGKSHKSLPEDTVARAVAASACFPPIFAPVKVGGDESRFADNPSPLLLMDGGLYDNLGLEPIIRMFRNIFISDAGAPFDYTVRPSGLAGLLGRYPGVLMRQIQNLRMREWFNLRDNTAMHENRRVFGAKWELKAPPQPSGDCKQSSNVSWQRPCAYPEDFTEKVIVNCRTDLNRFSELEAEVLENAGYMHCAIALYDRWALAPGSPPPPEPRMPHADAADAQRAAPDLATIGQRFPKGIWSLIHDLRHA